MHGLTITDVKKTFDGVQALVGISLSVENGQTLAVLGPSGCGKSTLLHLIAGIEQPDSGDIQWDGNSVLDLPPHRRGFGLMFQDYVLFPHLNVSENIVYGLRTAGWDESRIKKRHRELVEIVKIQGFDRRDVFSLSGGEQQRVALARSLASQPHLLMLDEPLGALDRSLRETLLEEIPAILQKTHQTTIYVTHDQEEAFALADRIAVMDRGRIIQIGTPKDIYYHPSTPFVAKFLGFTNFLAAQVHRDRGGAIVETAIGSWHIDHSLPIGRAEVLLRPDLMTLQPSSEPTLRGIVIQNTFRGASQTVTVEVNHHPLNLSFPLNIELPPGSEVKFGFDPASALHVFPKSPYD